ncbi:MAG: xanthine dehydrogenase family protein [Chloroflexi bacterium]|nr:MAG: xanthine dehydrogenase family protein [Chloroflexota bacterium]
MSILGTRVLRTEDPRFLTQGGRYVDDVPLEGALHVVFVRSAVAHARLLSVDVEEARRAPGVVTVVTAADVDVPAQAPELPMVTTEMARPVLAAGTVRFVGEPVAAVVAESVAAAVDAAELVAVDYDPLPVVLDLEESARDEVLLFPELGTNVAMRLPFPPSEDLFDGCEVVVRGRFRNQRVAPGPMEPRATAARWSDGRLTVWSSTQQPHGTAAGMREALGLSAEQVRVIAPDVGGGFGAKDGKYPEDLVVAWLARRLERPVRWRETRSENLVGMGHGRGQLQEVRVGGSRDGRIAALRIDVLQDCGAYPSLGAFLPFLTRIMAAGVYAIPRVECTARSVVTNTTSTTAYRGAGRPEAAAAVERAVDLFATEIGMDPAEVRRVNLVPRDAFPYTTPVGTVYDSGDYPGALERLLEAADYAGLRAEQARRREGGGARQLGIGLSVYVEITNGVPGGEYAGLEVRVDGSAVVRSGTSPHGQGHATAWAMLASDRLGIPMERIEMVFNDTDLVRSGVGTFGSRSLQVGGMAVDQAAVVVLDRARRLLAELLEADPADVVVDASTGRLHVAGSPAAGRSWAELAAFAAERGEPLAADVDFQPQGATFPFGAHLALVEVDTETGAVVLRRLVAVDDAGRIVNPLLAEGQRHGGIAQGAAQALLEEVLYDADGNPVTSTFADYGMITAAELPSFELVPMETPTPLNELGVKGIGESGTIGAGPAVQNAVVDALAHLGVRHVDMPATPQRVWTALREARR